MKRNPIYQTVIILIFLYLSYLFSQNTESKNLTSDIHPLGIAPKQQEGYGNGVNQLAQPDDVEFLKDGFMLVSDVNNNRLQLFSGDGTFNKTISAKDLHLEGEITPTGIGQDAEGFIYISCEGSGVVVRLNPDLTFDQFIGKYCDIKDTEYYCPENENCLVNPQGLAVSANGDVFIIDMEKSLRRGANCNIRNFGFRQFEQITDTSGTKYIYDKEFASTQEVTKVMRKSEGMSINESKNILFIAEEKPIPSQFENVNRYRYIAAFDLKSGKFLNKLYGVTLENGEIVAGDFTDSVEGVAVYKDFLFAVDEKAGSVFIFDIESGEMKGHFGCRAPFYCDDESNCEIDGINYNEQTIIAGIAQPHLKNSWQNNELASPDGINVVELPDGSKRLAVVDQWNMRIVIYDLDEIINLINKPE